MKCKCFRKMIFMFSLGSSLGAAAITVPTVVINGKENAPTSQSAQTLTTKQKNAIVSKDRTNYQDSEERPRNYFPIFPSPKYGNSDMGLLNSEGAGQPSKESKEIEKNKDMGPSAPAPISNSSGAQSKSEIKIGQGAAKTEFIKKTTALFGRIVKNFDEKAAADLYENVAYYELLARKKYDFSVDKLKNKVTFTEKNEKETNFQGIAATRLLDSFRKYGGEIPKNVLEASEKIRGSEYVRKFTEAQKQSNSHLTAKYFADMDISPGWRRVHEDLIKLQKKETEERNKASLTAACAASAAVSAAYVGALLVQIPLVGWILSFFGAVAMGIYVDLSCTGVF